MINVQVHFFTLQQSIKKIKAIICSQCVWNMREFGIFAFFPIERFIVNGKCELKIGNVLFLRLTERKLAVVGLNAGKLKKRTKQIHPTQALERNSIFTSIFLPNPPKRIAVPRGWTFSIILFSHDYSAKLLGLFRPDVSDDSSQRLNVV